MSVFLENILRRLQGVRRSGTGWMALCPAHEDRKPSLSVDEKDGRILFFCHAGCSNESVLNAARIEERELFAKGPTNPQIIAEYNYTDEQGVLLYQVVRYKPKAFRQRKPDGKGSWTWNLSGVVRVLYRLPDVISADQLLVVEGEKDVETAVSLGITATCSPGGAGKWREEYSEHLRGKQITIIADADEPGRKHAHQTAESLLGKAASVRVLEVPGAKDLSEWVDRGGTRETLEELIAVAPEWKPQVKSEGVQNEFRLVPLGELLDKPQTETEWVWSQRLAVGTVSMVVAKPKVGKSTLARNLALAISRGDTFLGFPTRRGTVVYLALEERQEDIAADFRALGATADDEILIHADSVPTDGMLAALKLVQQHKPVLLVVDPLFRLVRIRDEKAYAETYAALGPLIDLARETGTHVLLVHHSGKSAKADAIDSPLGSTALSGLASTLIVLRRAESHRLVQTVQRLGRDLQETILNFDAATHQLSLGGAKMDADQADAELAILEFLQDAGEPQTQAQIRSGVGGQTQGTRSALTALANTGKTGEGTRGKPFLYTFVNAGSFTYAETREPESRKATERNVDTGDILVPNDSEDLMLVPASTEPGDEEGEL
jgi:putative DNA primase/helicase